jgi:CubicO group peptidase (beta-lactamase class C family)
MKSKLFAYLFMCVGSCLMLFCWPNEKKNSYLGKHINHSETSEVQYDFEAEMLQKMSDYNIPGLSISIIEDGKISYSKGLGLLQYGNKKPVDDESIFSVGSISKVGTAVIVLKLVESGKIDLETSVNQYLKSWKLKDLSGKIDSKVTIKHLLSHTAGLNNYGFVDYQPDEKLPSTLQILQGSYPAKNNRVQITSTVGKDYKYSGGGTTILQLLVEEITKMPFDKAADSILFKPLKLNRSTYENPLPKTFGNIAKAHNSKGKPRALPRGYESMPESAASGLWTTSKNIASLMLTIMNSYNSYENTFLKQDLAKKMMSQISPSPHGLGPELKGQGKNKIFLHGGSNDSYKARFVGNLHNKNGYAVCVNGANGNDFIMDIEKLIYRHMNWNSSLIEDEK